MKTGLSGVPAIAATETGTQQYTTVERIREKQFGLTVDSNEFVSLVASDAAEANSGNYTINATGHSAFVGDIIQFTSGANSTKQPKVAAVSANVITLAENMGTIATGATFDILRFTRPRVSDLGALTVSAASSLVTFTKDGATVEVTEDTVTPSNNIPLPVKLTSVTGDINITAGDLNVQLSDVGANYDSTRIGDGTTLWGMTLSNEGKVSDSTAHTSLSSIDTRLTDVQNAVGTPGSPIPSKNLVIGGSDGTNSRDIHVDSSGDVQVDLASAIPAGTNTIGKVDLNRLSPVDFIDTTPAFDASAIQASSGAFVEIVASTAATIKAAQVFYAGGLFFGVYTGVALSETLAFIVGPGSNETTDVSIAAGTRLSVKSLTSSAGSSGDLLAINFLG